MATGNTKAAAGLTAQQWDDEFFTEYLTQNRFAGEFGTDENSIIQVKEDLSKKAGDRIYYALVNKLTNQAVLGAATLENNEEKMNSRSFYVIVDKRRNGVRVAEIDEQYSAISLRNASKTVLKDWSMKDTEKLIINSLASSNGKWWNNNVTQFPGGSIQSGGVAQIVAADMDTWLVNNADRVFSPGQSGTFTTFAAMGLTNDKVADGIKAAHINTMRYMALTTANPHIRPIRLAENGRSYFILYLDPRLFRDLKNELTASGAPGPIMASQQLVSLEKENNRLFEGGDLLWNGIIIKEIHEMYAELGANTFLKGKGTAATDHLALAFLCGAQAIGCAYAKRWRSREQTFDYGDKQGVAIDAIYGIDKTRFGTNATVDQTTPKDHGVITGIFATADAP